MPVTDEIRQDLIRQLNEASSGGSIVPFSQEKTEIYDDRSGIKLQVPVQQSEPGRRSEADVVNGRDPSKMYGEFPLATQKEISAVSEFLGFEGGFGSVVDLMKGAVEGGTDITSGTLANIYEQAGIQIGEGAIGLHEIRSMGDYLDWVSDHNMFTGGIFSQIPAPIRNFMRDEGMEAEFIKAANGIRSANDRFLAMLGADSKTPEDQTFLRALGAGGSSLVTALGISVLTKSPAAASAFFGVVQQSNVYLEAIDQGKTANEALMIANTAGVVESALEAIGLTQMLKFIKGGGSIVEKGVKGAMTEFVQEFLQEAAGTTITDVTGVSHVGVKAGLGRSLGGGIIGALTGGPASSVGGAITRNKVRDTLRTEQGIEGLTGAMLDAVANEMENQRDVDSEESQTERGKAGTSDRLIVEEIFEKAQQGIPVKEIYESAEQREASIQAGIKQIETIRNTTEAQVKGRQTQIGRSVAEATERLTNLGEEFDAEFRKVADEFKAGKENQQEVIDEIMGSVFVGGEVLEDRLGDAVASADETAFRAEIENSPKLSRLRDKIQKEQANIEQLESESAGITFRSEAVIQDIAGREIVTKGSVLERIRRSEGIKRFKEGVREGKKAQRAETESVQLAVRDVINDLPISRKAKNKLKDRIPKIQTLRQLDTAIDKIATSAVGVSIRESRKHFKKQIEDIIKSTKVKQGGKGRMTPEAQAMFDNLRKLLKEGRNEEQQLDHLQDSMKVIEGHLNDNGIQTQEDTMAFRFINLQLTDPSVFELADFFADLQGIRADGRLAGTAEREKRKARIAELKKQILDIKGYLERDGATTKSEDMYARVNFLVQTYFTLINKWGMAGTDLDISREDVQSLTLRNTWLDRISKKIESLSLEENYLRTLRKKEKIFEVENPKKKGSVRKYDKGEVVYLSMILQNESIREQFLDEEGAMGWTQEDIDRLNGQLTANDKELTRELFSAYEEIYEQYNKVYRQQFHMDLPKVDFYSHVMRFSPRGVEMNALSESTFFNEKGIVRNPKSTLARKKAASVPFRVANVVDVYTKYVYDVSHYIAYAEKMDIINSTLRDAEIQDHLIGVMGVQEFHNLEDHLSALAKSAITTSQVDRLIEKFRQNYFKVALGFKAKIGLGQVASQFAFKAEVPTLQWARYQLEFLFNWRKAIKIMNQNKTIRNRGKNFDPEIQQLGSLGSITKWSTMPIKIGDVSAIYAGGWAMYRYLTNDKGVSSDEALRRVAEFSERSQQSVMPSNMTLAQKSDKTFDRALMMFRSSPIAMLNMSLQAVHTYKNGPRTLKNWNKMMQTLALQNIVIPVVFNTVALGQKATYVAGSLVAIPFVGEVYLAIMTILFNTVYDDEERVFAPDLGVSIFQFAEEILMDIEKVANGIKDDDSKFEDWMAVAGDTLEAAWGIPVDSAFNVLKGFGDLFEGDIDKGVLEMLGYPPSKVEKVTGGSKTSSLAGRI